MTFLPLLVGCFNPGLVDPVEAQLASGILDRAETPVRLFVAISGLVAEGCGVPTDEDFDMEDYTFVGGAATALNATQMTLTVGDSSQEWLFPAAGLSDIGAGELRLTTTADRGSFEVIYYAPSDIVVTGTIPVYECDVTNASSTGIDLRGEVATGGSLEYTSETVTTKVAALGVKPFAGLHYNPPTAAAPTSGWAKWSDEGSEREDGDVLELEGALDIDLDEGVWPAEASGTTVTGQTWSRGVSVGFP